MLERQTFVQLCEQPWRPLPAGETKGDVEGGQKAGGPQDHGKLEAYPTEAELEPITDPAEHRILLRLLHDLGVVVAHGLTRDASAAQREITLLDPNWLTTAIYKVLNSRQVVENSGEFSRSDLDVLLDPAIYPREWHEFIINMMQDPEIALCFRLNNQSGQSDAERYLIPAALTKIEPEYENIWQEQDSLRFRYDYDFLPPTMLARFIVESHAHVTPTRWRTGVVLRIKKCPILIRIPTNTRRIDILITGPKQDRRDALAVVRSNFDFVHDLNPECKAKALVPLPDQPDVSVSHKHLHLLESTFDPTHAFIPDGAKRSYKVSELLDSI